LYESPESALAAIIVLDQFSRNMFRADSRAFASDPLALYYSKIALRLGYEKKLTGQGQVGIERGRHAQI
jgi:uncharacterized protein (DUF924 family)